MESKLPELIIEGTCFLVDVNKRELVEKGNPENAIIFENMYDLGHGYAFDYNVESKNVPVWGFQESTKVEIPDFVILDPVGMANKYGISLEEIKGKSDFDLMVDQKAFNLRLHGALPTIDIAGDLFYVDLRLDMLRPKDDFLSQGIVFDKIDHYFSEERNAYMIPYDPEKHEFRELDYDKITEYPKDLIAVEFPFQKELDPIGWNSNCGVDIKVQLKQIGLKRHFLAKTIPWNDTYIGEIIKGNLEKQKKQDQSNPTEKQAVPKKPQKKKEGVCKIWLVNLTNTLMSQD